MNAEDQAIFGEIYDRILGDLPDSWEMSVTRLPGSTSTTGPRFRGLAANPLTDDSILVHGTNQLVAISRLAEAVTRYFANRPAARRG